jgi:hypothetical protein
MDQSAAVPVFMEIGPDDFAAEGEALAAAAA